MSRTDEKKSVSRREALMTIGVAGGAAVVAGSVSATARQASSTVQSAKGSNAASAAPAAKPVSVAQLDEVTRALFAPIQAHGRVGDCTLVAVHGVTMGAIPVVLATADGAQFQVDVLRHDASVGGVNGVRTAGSLTVALHNESAGNSSTREAHGLGAMALLDMLAAREAEGATLPALLTLSARVQRFPRGVLGVLALA